MRKIKKSNELLWLLGIVGIALGVAICSKSKLGVSMIAAPAFILSEALQPVFSFISTGMMEYVFQGFLLLVMCIVVKRFRWSYLLAFAVAMFYGGILDIFLKLFSGFACSNLVEQILVLLLGDLVTGFGVACCFRTYMPLMVTELFVSEIATIKSLNLAKFKSYFDKGMFALSIVLILVIFRDVSSFDWSTIVNHDYHSMGLGTIITVIINAPIINTFGKLIDKVFDNTPRFEKLEKMLKR